MTQRLYYTDPYARSFDATVQRVERAGGRGDARAVVYLDRTAFYPTTGGQPYDTGTLAGIRVVDVQEEEDGRVAHVVEIAASQALTEGQAVHGEIDWERRFEHMQQHTGQHVLSAAFVRLFEAPTVSFHLGAEGSTIDLARELTAAEIAGAEAEANRIVWEDRPVAIRFASREEAAALPLRKDPVREGTLRLIDVDGWDLSACGGTHVARTGAIGIIAVAAWERFKGGQRIEFLCGSRALRRFGGMRDVIAAGVRLLSVAPQELPMTIERLQGEAKDQKRASAALEGELARFRAAELAAAAEPTPAGRLVLRALDSDAGGLKSVAAAIVSEPGFVAVLLSTSSPSLLVVARSADVSVAAQKVVAGLLGKFGGRGGGRPELAQAGGLTGTPDAILDAARGIVTQG
jgi:alanyl-tRNA synthetase